MVAAVNRDIQWECFFNSLHAELLPSYMTTLLQRPPFSPLYLYEYSLEESFASVIKRHNCINRARGGGDTRIHGALT